MSIIKFINPNTTSDKNPVIIAMVAPFISNFGINQYDTEYIITTETKCNFITETTFLEEI